MLHFFMLLKKIQAIKTIEIEKNIVHVNYQFPIVYGHESQKKKILSVQIF